MSKEEKLLILQMVAEGKITPEQGVELLKAVSSTTVHKEPVAGSTQEFSASFGETFGKSVEERVKKTVEEGVKKAENVAKRAVEHAQCLSESVEKRLEDLGEKTGESIGQSAENLVTLVTRLFSGGFSSGPQFELREELRGEFTEEGEIDVSLHTANGRITVETWDNPGYLLEVVKKVRATDEDQAKKLLKDVFEFEQDGLCLKAKSKDVSAKTLGGRNVSVGFNLKIPVSRKASLNLGSSNGRISIENVAGTKCIVNTANGRIEARRCNFEEVSLDTANGRIEYKGKASNLRANTANGRIEARLSGVGTWNFSTANGRIEIEIEKEENAGYEVDVSTVMGKLDVSGMDDAIILVDETKRKIGSKRYKACTKGYQDSALKASLKASSAMGRVTVSF